MKSSTATAIMTSVAAVLISSTVWELWGRDWVQGVKNPAPAAAPTRPATAEEEQQSGWFWGIFG